MDAARGRPELILVSEAADKGAIVAAGAPVRMNHQNFSHWVAPLIWLVPYQKLLELSCD
jgi:hypothetical protein